MEINIKKIKPLFNQIITTANVSEVIEGELITDVKFLKKGGDLLEHQTVICVGEAVRSIKPGDTVLLRFDRYAVRKYKQDANTIKDNMDEFYREQVIRYDIPSYVMDGQKVLKLYDNDVEFIIEEFEEVKSTPLIGTKPTIIL